MAYYRPITIKSDVPHFNPASSFASNCNLHRRHGSRLKGKMDRQEVAPQHRLARDKCGRSFFFLFGIAAPKRSLLPIYSMFRFRFYIDIDIITGEKVDGTCPSVA